MKRLSKEYKQMCKKWKKIICKDAKNAARDPFDWNPGLQVFVDHLYFMRDYYRNGENVWACEVEDAPSREQCLNMIIAEYEDWMNCEDKYTKVIFKDEPGAEEEIKRLVSLGYHLKEEDDEMFKDVVFLYKFKDFTKNTNAMVKEYNYHRKRFFELLGEYLEFLWD